MLDIKFIRENRDKVEESIKNRNLKVDLEKLFESEKEYKKLLVEVDELRADLNKISDVVKMASNNERRGKIKSAKEISNKIKDLEPDLKENKEKYLELLYKVPNIISEDTSIGKDENDNKVLKEVGEIPKFDFKVKDHMELGVDHGVIDTEKSAKISGSRFNYLFGGVALMQFALIQFGFNVLADKKIIKELADKVGNPFNKPFVPAMVPVMVKSEVMKKMDRFDPVEDRYYMEKDDVLLVGSAEHTLGPLHMNETMDYTELPLRYVGYSTSFRREAGTYGKDMKGIFRRHQFDKLEMETFTSEEYGLKEQDLLVAIQEYLMQKLKIPYRVVLKCTGDMGGKADYRAIDIESWIPSQDKYRETHTSDYMTDYQSRRLNTKYKDKEGNKKFVHMNDATVFGIGRTLIAIIENYQKKDGSIGIPEVLQKYMGGLKEIKK